MAKATRTLERRVHTGEVEIRSRGDKAVIEGHAAVFDKRSQNLGGFVEVVRRTAFTKTLQEADVRALQNHDENLVLGRNIPGTLELSIDDSGLYYRIMPPDTSYANDLMVLLERGDVDQSSFQFTVEDDEWKEDEEQRYIRTIKKIRRLYDVSPVTYPAYPDASVALRSLENIIQEQIPTSEGEGFPLEFIESHLQFRNKYKP